MVIYCSITVQVPSNRPQVQLITITNINLFEICIQSDARFIWKWQKHFGFTGTMFRSSFKKLFTWKMGICWQIMLAKSYIIPKLCFQMPFFLSPDKYWDTFSEVLMCLAIGCHLQYKPILYPVTNYVLEN